MESRRRRVWIWTLLLKKTAAELSSLRGQLMDKEKELNEFREAIGAGAKKGKDALAAYKKKAQQSLRTTHIDARLKGRDGSNHDIQTAFAQKYFMMVHRIRHAAQQDTQSLNLDGLRAAMLGQRIALFKMGSVKTSYARFSKL
jgi:hypothetical protein